MLVQEYAEAYQIAILRTPVLKRRIADAVLPAKYRRQHSHMMLLQSISNLPFREPAAFHRPSPSLENGPEIKSGDNSGGKIKIYP